MPVGSSVMLRNMPNKISYLWSSEFYKVIEISKQDYYRPNFLFAIESGNCEFYLISIVILSLQLISYINHLLLFLKNFLGMNFI